MIRLRRFFITDLNEVMDIERTSFPQPWSKSYIGKLSQRYPQDFVVANFSKKVVGYILGYKKPNGLGSIKTLAVNPNFRQQGIGTKLVNFTTKRLKKESVKEVFLHTRTKNQIAILFYKKLGFKILKKIENYYKNGDNAYLMVKKI